MKAGITDRSNPGPSWGYRTIGFFEKILPDPLFRVVLGAGVWIALAVMTDRRRNSQRYYKALTGKQPTLLDTWRHFMAFMDSLILKLQAGRGKFPRFAFSDTANEAPFVSLCKSDRQILFGSFHVGFSDMLGCMLKDFDRSIHMVRLKVGNSHDTDLMASVFSGNLRFLWINDPQAFIFQLKEALQAGASIGMQCDRTTPGSKTELFSFLGGLRDFPMTIYHLSYLFAHPVVFAFTTGRNAAGKIPVYTSPVFEPVENRQEHMTRSREHFQAVLNHLEAQLMRHPELWFNFLPLKLKSKEGKN